MGDAIHDSMTDVIVARTPGVPVNPGEWAARAKEDSGCFDLYRARWCQSFVADDGTRLICHFRAPDADSVRMAFRASGEPDVSVWPARVTRLSPVPDAALAIECESRVALPSDDVRAIESMGSSLPAADVFRLGFVAVSRDRRRVIFVGVPRGAKPGRHFQPEFGSTDCRLWNCRTVMPKRVNP